MPVQTEIVLINSRSWVVDHGRHGPGNSDFGPGVLDLEQNDPKKTPITKERLPKPQFGSGPLSLK